MQLRKLLRLRRQMHGEEQSNAVEEEQKLQHEESQETCNEDQNKETEDSGSKASETAGDDENKCILSNLFVHSQWLAVQSPYSRPCFIQA